MYITLNFEPKTTESIVKYVEAKMPEIVEEAIFKDKNLLQQLIREAVRGSIKASIAELMQGKDFRDYLRNRIMEEIGMKKNSSEWAGKIIEIKDGEE